MRETKFIKNKISVIIITYNQHAFISDTIESVRNQDVDDLEIIVADDGSTDGSQEIIKAFSEKDRRVIPVLAANNGGISKNFNQAFPYVTGEYIAILGGDDLMLPKKLRIQSEFMIRHSQVQLCYHDVEVFDTETGRKLYNFTERNSYPKNIEENLFFTNWLFRKKEVKLCPSSTFARSEYYMCNLYDYRLTYTNEMLHGMLNYLSAPYGELAFLDDVLGRYRIHSNNITRKIKPFYESLEEYQILYAISVSRYPESIHKIANYVNFHLFKAILYKGIPLEKRKLYEKVFLKHAGIIRYLYLRICEKYLQMKGL